MTNYLIALFNNIWIVMVRKKIALHVLCWILFMAYELVSLYYISGRLEAPKVYFFYYSINIGYFYCNVFLLNFIFNRLKPIYLNGALMLILLFCVYMFAKSSLDYFLTKPNPSFTNQFIYIKRFIIGNLFRCIYFMILSTFYWASGYIAYYKKQANESEKQQLLSLKEKAELESSLSKSQNAYLRQQINPHMLFNTLNFIYNNVYKNSPEAARSIHLLSEIMRFNLEATDPDGKVLLSKELEQLQFLLEINRYRFDLKLYMELSVEGDLAQRRIIPLILFTLTENIFKHGNLRNKNYPAKLEICLAEDGRLTYHSRNLKKSNGDIQKNNRIGLQNVKIRLDFDYSNNYTLNISESADFYELTLNLIL